MTGRGAVASGRELDPRAPSRNSPAQITTMRLTVRGKVPGIDQVRLQKAAEAAAEGCPVSGALKGSVRFTLDAKLE